MDDGISNVKSQISNLLRAHFLPLALGVAGVIFFVYGLNTLSGPKKDKPDILFEAASDKAPLRQGSAGQADKSEIAVDVEGAVMKPGVYKLKADSRVQDGLIAAGGMSEEADREKVAKSLNLASKLTDGAKLYVSRLGESDTAALAGQTVAGSSVVNINSATASELEELPGIGKVTAEKIIDNRPYSKIEDLLDKKVVGKSVFEKIKGKISI